MSRGDDLETRSAKVRMAAQLDAVNAQLRQSDHAVLLGDLSRVTRLPVLRKADITKAQAEQPPFWRDQAVEFRPCFLSPDPIYEPGGIPRLLAHASVPASLLE